MFRQMGFKTSDESKAEPQSKFGPVMGFQGLLACGVRVMYIPYARHYKHRLAFFTPFFTAANKCGAAYTAERLIFHGVFFLNSIRDHFTKDR